MLVPGFIFTTSDLAIGACERLASKRHCVTKDSERRNQDPKRLKSDTFANLEAKRNAKKSVHFCPEIATIGKQDYSMEDVQRSWLTEKDEVASRHSICFDIAAFQASINGNDLPGDKESVSSMRGLEHVADPMARDRRVARGKLVRRAILHCLSMYGADTAATLSNQLSVANVRAARAVAAHDFAAAAQAHVDTTSIMLKPSKTSLRRRF
jgi:hypothetical protein